MFTGIIEGMGKVVSLDPDHGNLHIELECPFTSELKVDQSVSHNGVCLTVVEINASKYKVTAISETLQKSNLGSLKVHDLVNLERSLLMHGRLDGHIVQGHVDLTGKCMRVDDQKGSWVFTFQHASGDNAITIKKGSVCVNGVSLTVVDSGLDNFSVAVIPYTYEHTNFKNIQPGDAVNLEFDVIGKYVAKLLALQGN